MDGGKQTVSKRGVVWINGQLKFGTPMRNCIIHSKGDLKIWRREAQNGQDPKRTQQQQIFPSFLDIQLCTQFLSSIGFWAVFAWDMNEALDENVWNES